MLHQVFLSLGSNMNDRLHMLKTAMGLVEKNAGNILKESCVYCSEPWGFAASQGFLNNVILIQTKLEPLSLLKTVKEIEISLGRKPKQSSLYESRPIDIDLLFYENLIMNEPELTLPHPLLQDRKFVLIPLEEIAPNFIHPVSQYTVKQMLEQTKDNSKVEHYHP